MKYITFPTPETIFVHELIAKVLPMALPPTVRPATNADMSSDINCGRAMAELIPPEIIPGDTPLEKALNLAINAALNDEMDDLHDQLQNLLIEHPSPTVSRAIFQPTVFPAARRERALNDAVSELLKCRQRKDEGELLAKMRNAATPEERMKFLIELQNANKSQMEVNL
jgi:hypothetical protein